MKRPIALALSPNAEFDDVWCVVRLLTKPFSLKQGSYISKLEKDFSKLFGDDYRSFSINSGRGALFLLLQALELPSESEVVVQAFTCAVVPTAILSNQLTPVFADIDTTYNISPQSLEAKITKKTRVVIVQHTFGVPADMDALKRVIMKKEKLFGTKIVVVEDCAHSLGAVYKKRVVGTHSDAAIFSFGRDKVISSVFGGMILTKDRSLITSIKSRYKSLTFPSNAWTIQQLLHPILFMFIILPLYYVGIGKLTLGKTLLVFLQKIHILSKPVFPEELMGTMSPHFPKRLPNALAALATLQLTKLDRFTKSRIKFGKMYAQSGLQMTSTLPEGVSYLRYPLSVYDPSRLISFAKDHGVLLGNWYHNVIDPTCRLSVFGYKVGSCPEAEMLAKRVVNLPTHPTMSDRDQQTVISVISLWKNTQ